MNPGATILPVASIAAAVLRPERLPMAAMRSPLIPTSAGFASPPAPSMTEPPRITSANSGAREQAPSVVAALKTNVNATRRNRIIA